ncbi:pyridoxamine 5'-phosphate oxidase family protein [Congregibacter litoralis]|uniref:Putative heme iron utilization protein n=1 Tax=Congregibacter litoralis KT71 TaxID=314285 RepID=A4A515_9GAMM|nr:pyridoxamine 5'-phosphate oxidase family protein [Congregibacter litoralis]EAQ98886.1 putative heme iron utilization protein [Congregibacter litoralis KT71]
MKNTALQSRLAEEVLGFIGQRKTLQLATLGEDGVPYASYAPFAVADDRLYVVLSDIAVHGLNLLANPRASVLIIEDEDSAEEYFARVRVNYQVRATQLKTESDAGNMALNHLEKRFGERPRRLSELADFRLFSLAPVQGRYVKGFGRAYTLSGGTLGGENIEHLREGHRPRVPATA